VLLVGHWTARGIAEQDPKQKQIIPYMVVNSMGKVLAYWRSVDSGEQRLHGKRSIGFGGHIEASDSGLDGMARSPLAAFYAGAQRELQEEVKTETPAHARLIGFINDDSNDVGKVHVGVVFSVRAAGAIPCSEEHSSYAWVSREEAMANIEDFEIWSRLLIQSDAFWDRMIPMPQPRRLTQFRNPGGAVMYSPHRDVAYLGQLLLRKLTAAITELDRTHTSEVYAVALRRSGLDAEAFDAECVQWLQAVDAILTKAVQQESDNNLFVLLQQASIGVTAETVRYMLMTAGQAFLTAVLAGIRDVTHVGEESDFTDTLAKVYPKVQSSTDGVPPYEAAIGSLRGAIQNARQHGVSFEDIGLIVQDFRIGRD